MSPKRVIWYINKAYWTMLIASEYIVKPLNFYWPFPNWYFKLKTIKITLFNSNLWYRSLQIVRHENKVYLYHVVEEKGDWKTPLKALKTKKTQPECVGVLNKKCLVKYPPQTGNKHYWINMANNLVQGIAELNDWTHIEIATCRAYIFVYKYIPYL